MDAAQFLIRLCTCIFWSVAVPISSFRGLARCLQPAIIGFFLLSTIIPSCICNLHSLLQKLNDLGGLISAFLASAPHFPLVILG